MAERSPISNALLRAAKRMSGGMFSATALAKATDASLAQTYERIAGAAKWPADEWLLAMAAVGGLKITRGQVMITFTLPDKYVGVLRRAQARGGAEGLR